MIDSLIGSLTGATRKKLTTVRAILACAILAAPVLAGAAIAQMSAPTQAPDAKPQRVVSLNLCTDQLLMQLAEPRRIAAVTFLARDPRTSAMVDEAARLPVTSGVAEEVISLEPDLVLAGTFSTRQTITILRQLGYRVVEFEPETDIASTRRNIRQMAAALGERARGEAMVAEIDRHLARVPDVTGRRPVYADYDANGFTSGSDTLLASLARIAGFQMLGERLGFAGPRQIPLEQMLVARPEIIDPGAGYSGAALATQMLQHPALQRLMRERSVIDVPSAYTTCGNLRSLRALDVLVKARRAFDG